jgi:cardiolipin synthase
VHIEVEFIHNIFLVAIGLADTATIGYILFAQRGTPAKTISWILLVLMLPFAGVLLYFTFGVNYRRVKLYNQKKTDDIRRYHQLIDNEYTSFEESSWIERKEVQSKSGLAKLLLKSSKSLFSDHNHVEVLQNGPITYEKILEELASAKQLIHFQFYIIDEGLMTKKLLSLFEQKRNEGVEIRILYDAVGCWSLSNSFKNKLTKIGVEHHAFLPVRFVQLANKINYRNHRKIIVIDGQKGFTGGINIADKYLHGNELGVWRDTFLYLEGNAVNGLQYLFLTDWSFATRKDEVLAKYFKRVKRTVGTPVQIVGSGPDSDYAGIKHEYDELIHSAQYYIYISNPYLIPGEIIESALISAAMRGVDVRILIPGISDYKIVKWSTNSYLSPLLRAGVRIYKYQAGFLHSKVIVSDDVVSSIGTGNMDIRSFEYNFEVNAVIFDSVVAKRLKNDFKNDCLQADEIDYELWKKRPAREKMLESLSRVVSPLL